MTYRATAKQRLWLTCLGYDVSKTAESDEARSLFEDASASHIYQEAPNSLQRRFARSFGVSIEQVSTRHDAAGKLYHVLLLRAWVYSVWRTLSGENAGDNGQLSLADATALAVAREMETLGLFEQVEKYSTTDGREADVFYRMSKGAQSSEPFKFVATRLPEPPPKKRQPSQTASGGKRSKAAGKRASARAHRGTGCLVLVALSLIVSAACVVGCAWGR